MRILFLDIDGVLCTERGEGRGLNKDCVRTLFRVIKETGCLVVITSSWRKSERFLDKIRAADIPFVGLTDDLSMPEDAHGAVHRSLEIKLWIKDNPQITKFAILDDDRNAYRDDDMKPFFKTSYRSGLTPQIGDRVIDYLKG